ncbi:hypothetical protein D9611_008346 [Ephemerocybe angulata]|uniref:Ankyrin n=1 Tax=Ephemerocybe angulata TaxID=980116 RepID=A0A8H5BJM3_9AGAR|nr:hypothetical protein D9611_008346 [Tulosesus angulatus]
MFPDCTISTFHFSSSPSITMSAGSCIIPGNPDIAGIGVRIAIYVQNLLCFFPAFWALIDGKVTENELESAETQATTNLVLAFAILISSMVQATTLGLTSYHASIVLNMSWMNNTNAFIYFLLYVQHRSQVTSGSGHIVEPTFRAWARHIRCSFLPGTNTGQVNHTSGEESGQSGGPSVQAVDNETGMPTLPSPSERPKQLDGAGATTNEEVGNGRQTEDIVNARMAAKNLVKRYVLPLGSLHLSLMAALGLWLWIDIRGFGNMRDTANNCAAEHALISILGSHIPFASGALRITSFVIYGLFLVPGLNLLLPIVVFLGFHYCARGSPPTIMIKPAPYPRRQMYNWEHPWDTTLRWVQELIARWWSVLPPVLGLVFLLAINLVFIIDIELTLKQNAHLQRHDEAEWGFGQILAILLLFIPLRDLAEALLTRRMQKEVNLGFKNAVNLQDWDSVLAFVARGADPNVVIEGEVTAIRSACFSDRVDVVRALLDAGSDPNIESGPKRDTKVIQRENKDCLQLLRNYDNRVLDGTLALNCMVVKEYHIGVKLLLAAPGINVNGEDKLRRAALIIAAHQGTEAVVKLLLAVPGIDVNVLAPWGWTPLSLAARNGHEAVVKLLLAAPGIDVNASDDDGMTPLSFAATYGHEAVVKLLLAAPGIDVNAPSTGGTALFWAAIKGQEAIIKDLCAVPEIIVNVADVKRRLEHPPGGIRTRWGHPASKDEQEKCVRILEGFVKSKGGGAQDGSEGVGPSGGQRDSDP